MAHTNGAVGALVQIVGKYDQHISFLQHDVLLVLVAWIDEQFGSPLALGAARSFGQEVSHEHFVALSGQSVQLSERHGRPERHVPSGILQVDFTPVGSEQIVPQGFHCGLIRVLHGGHCNDLTGL